MDFLLFLIQTYVTIGMTLALYNLLAAVPPRWAWLTAIGWPLFVTRLFAAAFRKKS